MRFPDSFLQTLRDRAPIVAYAARKLTFDQRKSQPQRGDYWACCPFHGEKTASFHLLDRKGIFKCFGCGEAGDVFKLVMKLEGLSFPEAVERLAAEAGMALPEEDPRAKAAHETRQRAQSALDAAAAFYREALRGTEGRSARDYLLKRGVGPEVWAHFGLGWASAGWTNLIERLRRDGYTLDQLREAGLLREREGRGPSDFFHGRVMFPIQDGQGRLIGFGGRLIEAGEPKYLNSPETPLFHKGRALYRLSAARALAAKAKAEGLVVAEGYMDVIAFERAGIAAVAPLGTALTEDQLDLIWRAGPTPILCFDGDAAGVRAAERALDLALPKLSPERTLRFVTLPGGADPDDLFRKEGPDALIAALGAAKPAIEALFERERTRKPLDTPEAKAGFKERLRAAAGRIGHEETRRQYLRDLLSRADAALRPPRPEFAAGRKPEQRGGKRKRGAGSVAEGPPTPQTIASAKPSGVTSVEDVLRLAVDVPSLLERGAEPLAQLAIPDLDLKRIRDALLDVYATQETLDRSTLSSHLRSLGEEGAVARLAHWPACGPLSGPSAERRVDEATESQWMALVTLDLMGSELGAEIAALRARGEAEMSDAEFARMQAEMSARRERVAAALSAADGRVKD